MSNDQTFVVAGFEELDMMFQLNETGISYDAIVEEILKIRESSETESLD